MIPELEDRDPPFTLIEDDYEYAQYVEYGENTVPRRVKFVLYILLLIGTFLVAFVAYYTVLSWLWSFIYDIFN